MDRCPFRHDVVRCQCDSHNLKAVHHGELAYYPQAGWLRVGRRLFRLRWIGRHGQHFWDCLVRLLAVVGVVKTRGSCNTCYISCVIPRELDPNEREIWAGVDFLSFSGWPWLGTDHGGMFLSPIVLIWRIQRAVRQFLKRNFEKRALAWMMGSHARLSCGTAGTADIPADISRMILSA